MSLYRDVPEKTRISYLYSVLCPELEMESFSGMVPEVIRTSCQDKLRRCVEIKLPVSAGAKIGKNHCVVLDNYRRKAIKNLYDCVGFAQIHSKTLSQEFQKV